MVEKAQAQNLIRINTPKKPEKTPNNPKNYSSMSTEELKSKIKAMQTRHATLLSIAGPPKEEIEELEAMKRELAKRTGQPYQPPRKFTFDSSPLFKGFRDVPPEFYHNNMNKMV